MSNGLLEGKVAVITGAASPNGIGFATAKLFAKHGAKVVILDLDEKAAADAAASIGPEHRGYACNVADKQSCDAAVARAVAEFGAVNVLIANAGITQPAKVCDITPADWDRIMSVNLDGVLYMSQAVVPYMKKQGGGSIACMSSVSAQRGGGILGGPHYSAAKAGVLGLAKAMARELGIDGIRVNCVAPGLVYPTQGTQDSKESFRESLMAATPLRRLARPEDVAGPVLFLASELSGFMTGQLLLVDGGLVMR